MADQGRGVLSRWSRRKLARRHKDPRAQAGEDSGAAVAASSTATGGTAASPPDGVPDLPPIESLTAESDFTPFLQEGVPEDLRRLALRRLWRLTPGVPDGLDDYDEDFTMIGTVAEKVSTLFRHGEGMRTREEQAAEDEARPVPPEGADVDTDSDDAGDPDPDDDPNARENADDQLG